MCIQNSVKQVKLFTPDYKGHQFANVDTCISGAVQALNDAGMKTIASCCGHGKQPSRITLEDGREMFIFKDYETAQKISKMFPQIS